MKPNSDTRMARRPTFPIKYSRLPWKIALEEAVSTSKFNATATLPSSDATSELPYVDHEYVNDVRNRLLDITARVDAMDHAGVALAVISLAMPGIEGIFDAKDAVRIAREVNDEIHDTYTTGKYSERFRAFGCVAMQNPAEAAREAERCVKQLNCLGILVNGFCNLGGPDRVQYLDEPRCEPFWAKMEELDVPLYLHPRIPPPSQMRAYDGYKFLAGSPWGFGVETATHAIRLMVSGLFDRHPRLKIILGHCGEGLPFSLYRIDHRIRHFQPEQLHCKLSLQEYWQRNFWVTTAGVMSDSTLGQTLQLCGEERVMWSVDYPFEDYDEIGTWFDCLEMNPSTKANIGWRNAQKLFGLEKLPAYEQPLSR